MALAIEISQLDFAYCPGVPVLQDINLKINPGEKFGIIGPSGAGKSTLLLHLNGILHGKGRVSIGEIPVIRKNIDQIRERVGLVFQNPDDQLFNPTVEDDIAFGPLNFGLSPAETSRRVQVALSAMNLHGFEQRSPHQLSLGERKRVALATVLALQPQVIAFDEPFSNLDPAMVQQVMQCIQSLTTTVVIISQSILPMVNCCDRIAILNHGRIQAVAPAREIISNQQLMQEHGLDIQFYKVICKQIFG